MTAVAFEAGYLDQASRQYTSKMYLRKEVPYPGQFHRGRYIAWLDTELARRRIDPDYYDPDLAFPITIANTSKIK